DLEDRVRTRTSELSTSNRQLTREIAERMEAQRQLIHRERQLAEAQQLARIGSWEWLIPGNRMTWSDEMYRIHGHRPQEFPVTFERAIEQVVPADVDRIRNNVAALLESRTKQASPAIEYRIIRPDGAERVLFGKSRLTV